MDAITQAYGTVVGQVTSRSGGQDARSWFWVKENLRIWRRYQEDLKTQSKEISC